MLFSLTLSSFLPVAGCPLSPWKTRGTPARFIVWFNFIGLTLLRAGPSEQISFVCDEPTLSEFQRPWRSAFFQHFVKQGAADTPFAAPFFNAVVAPIAIEALCAHWLWPSLLECLESQ